MDILNKQTNAEVLRTRMDMRNSTVENHSLASDTAEVEDILERLNSAEVTTLYPLIVFYAAILIIGLIGNTLVLIVYSMRYKRSPARVYILFLASIDFSICLFGLPYHLIDLTHPYTFTSGITCKSLTFIITTLFHMSIFGLIVISVDRYLKICRPLGKLQRSYFGKRRSCYAAVLAAFLVSWPNIVLYGPSDMETNVPNVTGQACFFATEYLETQIPFIYTMVILCVCISSTIFLIVVYSLICHQIYTRYDGIGIIKRCKGQNDETTYTEDYSLKSVVAVNDVDDNQDVDQTNDGTMIIINQERKDKLNKRVDITFDTVESRCPSSLSVDCDVMHSRHSGIDQESINGELQVINEYDNQTELELTEGVYLLNRNETGDIQIHSDVHCPIVHENERKETRFSQRPAVPLKFKDDSKVFSENRSAFDPSYKERSHSFDTLNTDNKYNYQDKFLSDDRLQIPRDRAKENGLLKLIVKEYAKVDKSSNESIQSKASSKGEKTKIHGSSRKVRLEKSDARLSLPDTSGFPMCRPQVVHRRSSLQTGYVTMTGTINKGSRSSSLHASDDIYIGKAGLRVHMNTCQNLPNKDVKASRRNQVKSRQHLKITKIMLTITVVFILSYTPAVIVTLWSSLQPEIWDFMTMHQTIWCEFFLRFYLVNNICNPFIYGFWDKRFKREVAFTFRKIYGLIVSRCR